MNIQQEKIIEQERKKLEDEVLNNIKRMREDLSKILETAYGRRFIWDILKNICGVFKTTADVSNVYKTYFDEGKRKIGTHIMDRVLDIKPSFIVQMVAEETSEKNSKKVKK